MRPILRLSTGGTRALRDETERDAHLELSELVRPSAQKQFRFASPPSCVTDVADVRHRILGRGFLSFGRILRARGSQPLTYRRKS